MSKRKRTPLTKAKNLFLTFPQNSTTKEQLMTQIKGHFGDNLDYTIVCEEKHKDEGDHLHAFIALKKQLRVYWKDLDKFTGKHGNYQAARNKSKSVKYCMKDGSWIAHGFEPESYIKAASGRKSTKATIVAQEIIAGKSNYDLAKDPEHAGFLLQNLSKINAFRQFWLEEQLKRDKKAFFIPKVSLLSNFEDIQIASWLVKNVMCERRMNQAQLWIHGNTCKGKSTFIANLNKMLKVYIVNNMSNYMDGYTDDYELVVFDEFKGQKTLTFMNQFCDGSWMKLNQKFGGYEKRKSIPIIVCSNYPPEKAYRKVAEERPHIMDTLLRRFKVVKCENPISLYYNHNWDNHPNKEDQPEEEPEEPEEEPESSTSIDVSAYLDDSSSDDSEQTNQKKQKK